jgi:hypothetical protein
MTEGPMSQRQHTSWLYSARGVGLLECPLWGEGKERAAQYNVREGEAADKTGPGITFLRESLLTVAFPPEEYYGDPTPVGGLSPSVSPSRTLWATHPCQQPLP